MDIDRAKAIVNAAQAIINSAKVEVAFINATGMPASSFMGSIEDQRQPKQPLLLAANGRKKA